MGHSRGGFLEFKCSRAWLPDSSLWPWSPRDDDFDCGGWYVEQNRNGKYSSVNSSYRGIRNWRRKPFATSTSISHSQGDSFPSLCPTIPMLLCGFITLDTLLGNATTLSSENDH